MRGSVNQKSIILYETSSPLQLAELSEEKIWSKKPKCHALKVCSCSLLTEVVNRGCSQSFKQVTDVNNFLDKVRHANTWWLTSMFKESLSLFLNRVPTIYEKFLTGSFKHKWHLKVARLSRPCYKGPTRIYQFSFLCYHQHKTIRESKCTLQQPIPLPALQNA